MGLSRNYRHTLTASGLNFATVDPAGIFSYHSTRSKDVTTMIILILDVECMDMARYIAEDCKTDIDQDVGATTCNEEHAQWGD